jgi:hypothetical protein
MLSKDNNGSVCASKKGRYSSQRQGTRFTSTWCVSTSCEIFILLVMVYLYDRWFLTFWQPRHAALILGVSHVCHERRAKDIAYLIIINIHKKRPSRKQREAKMLPRYHRIISHQPTTHSHIFIFALADPSVTKTQTLNLDYQSLATLKVSKNSKTWAAHNPTKLLQNKNSPRNRQSSLVKHQKHRATFPINLLWEQVAIGEQRNTSREVSSHVAIESINQNVAVAQRDSNTQGYSTLYSPHYRFSKEIPKIDCHSHSWIHVSYRTTSYSKPYL